jgi:hypothetical protein
MLLLLLWRLNDAKNGSRFALLLLLLPLYPSTTTTTTTSDPLISTISSTTSSSTVPLVTVPLHRQLHHEGAG